MEEMNSNGKIIRLDGECAYVEIIRKTSCDSCESCESKGSCHSALLFNDNAKKLVIRAYNPLQAEIGEDVKIEVFGNKYSLLFATMIFVAPILLAIIAYYVTSIISKNSVIAYTASGVLFIASFLSFAKIADRYCKKNVEYKIVK